MACEYCNDLGIVPKGFAGKSWWTMAKYQGENRGPFEPCRCKAQTPEPQAGQAGPSERGAPAGQPTVVGTIVITGSIPPRCLPQPTSEYSTLPWRGIPDAYLTDPARTRIMSLNPNRLYQIAETLATDLAMTKYPFRTVCAAERARELRRKSRTRKTTARRLGPYLRGQVEEAIGHLYATEELLIEALGKLEEARRSKEAKERRR